MHSAVRGPVKDCQLVMPMYWLLKLSRQRAPRSSLAGVLIMMHLVERLQKLSSHQVRLGGLRFKLARVHTLLHNGACAGSCIRVCVCPVAMQGGM